MSKRLKAWSSISRCCGHYDGSKSLLLRIARMTGACLIASGRVPPIPGSPRHLAVRRHSRRHRSEYVLATSTHNQELRFGSGRTIRHGTYLRLPLSVPMTLRLIPHSFLLTARLKEGLAHCARTCSMANIAAQITISQTTDPDRPVPRPGCH